MPRSFPTRPLAALACAITFVGLSLAASNSASADPIAPPVTKSSTVSFVVPTDPGHAAAPVNVYGLIVNPTGTSNAAAITMTTRCNNESIYTATVTVSESNIGSTVQHDYRASTLLPSSERGHTCVVSTTAPWGQKVVMSQPYSISPDFQYTPLSVYIPSEVIRISPTGGLF